jgi:RNA polymerase sigma-70 factor, ECF subfamily
MTGQALRRDEVFMDSADAACITRIARGDQAALEALYTRYRLPLARYLWHQLHGDAQAVEEALQDTFVAIWRGAASFRGDARVATWIFRIARYSATHVRRYHSRASASVTFSLSDMAEEDEIATPGTSEDQTLTRMALHDALARLSDKQRMAVLLVFVHGFTSDEAAEILGLPVGTVKSRLHAARDLLANDPALGQREEVNP